MSKPPLRVAFVASSLVLLLVGQTLWGATRLVRSQGAETDVTPISAIQGAGTASDFHGEDVVTWGVVTALTNDGFYLQDPLGDGDPTTSDALFAFTYDKPTVTVGECVQVSAEVTEYYAKTELNWISSITPSSECGVASATPIPLPLPRPGDDPVDTLEPFEGMLVQLPPMMVHVYGPTKRFASGEAEIAFLPEVWQRYVGAAPLFHYQEAVSGLLFFSNRLGASLPPVQRGDRLEITGSGLVGVLDYNFGKYQLLPLAGQPLTVIRNDAAPASLPPARADEYGICSFNVHGLGQGTGQFPIAAEYEEAVRARAEVIATHLSGCTVIALQETGRPADALALAERLATDYGLTYDALAIEGSATYEAEFPLTNSLLVDRSRATVELADSLLDCSFQDYGIAPSGECPPGEYPIFDRPPLMAKIVIDGPPDERWSSAQTVWVINNHWKSKSGDEEANARLRVAQAGVVAERVLSILATDAEAQIVVLGDLNDFYGGGAVATLQDATGLFHPYEWLSPLQRYTYIFNGAAQVLDHALVTPNMAPQLALVQILHLHSGSAAGDSPLAQSDHDPVVLRFRPSGAASLGGTLAWGGITISAHDDSGALLAQTVTEANGDFRLWGLPPERITLQWEAPEWVVVDVPSKPFTVDAAVGMKMIAMPRARHTSTMAGAWIALQTPWLAKSFILPQGDK